MVKEKPLSTATPCSRSSPEDAGDVVGPVDLAAGAAGGETFVDEFGEGLVDVLVEVDGVGDEAAVGAGGDGDEGGEVDGGGHDEAVAVVGVLADEVDAAGCGEELGGDVVGGEVEGGEFGGGLHGRLSFG